MSKTNNQLKDDVEQELCWDPKIKAAKIGVSFDKGAVALLGAADTFAEPPEYIVARSSSRVRSLGIFSGIPPNQAREVRE
jgi:hypothetical protein